MKYFIQKLTIFLLLLFIIVFISGNNYGFKKETSDYMDAIIDKHHRIENIASPRLIFVGGSNLAFGIDSKKIQDSIGLPVVNLGLHAGLGLEYIINEIKLTAKSSDIVILSIEYFLGIKGDYELQKISARNFPFAKEFYTKNYYSDIKTFFVKELPKNLRTNLTQIYAPSSNTIINFDTSSVYSRSSFNVFGDVIRHLNKPLPAKIYDRSKFTYRYWEGIDFLNNFANYAKSKNIKVYFLYPNYPETEYTVNKEVIMKYANDIAADLNIQVLNNTSDFVFSDSLFYDTVYHLNKLGREKRTNRLIEILKKLNK